MQPTLQTNVIGGGFLCNIFSVTIYCNAFNSSEEQNDSNF